MGTATKLTTREARKKLAVRTEPYWSELSRGRYLGYRRGATGGFWVLREHSSRMGKKGAYIKRRLGPADDDGTAAGALSWEEAKKVADGAERPTVTRPGRYTVAQAAEVYFNTRSATGDHDKVIFASFIAPKLGDRAVNDLTTGDIEAWLAAQVPAGLDREKRRAAQATANRRFNVLRAVLNSAFRKDDVRVPSDGAWRRVSAFPNADKARTRVLTTEEAKRLLNALAPPLRALARGALYTGCRLGELEALTVADVADGKVTVQHSKSGRSRTIPLSADGVTFFAQTTAGKAGDARVFEPIGRVALTRAMWTACGWHYDRKTKKRTYQDTAAKINPAATFHDLRRSYGSLLLNSGASADVIQELLGHADLRMTRRAYAHLLKDTLQKAVDKYLPSFGLENTNVTPIKRSVKKRVVKPA
jgi:integrase